MCLFLLSEKVKFAGIQILLFQEEPGVFIGSASRRQVF